MMHSAVFYFLQIAKNYNGSFTSHFAVPQYFSIAENPICVQIGSINIF